MVAKNAERTLVIAPKGTVKDEHGVETNHDPAQWIKEFNSFAPDIPVYPLFSRDDYYSYLDEEGELPMVYLSAMTMQCSELKRSSNCQTHGASRIRIRLRISSESVLLSFCHIMHLAIQRWMARYEEYISSGVGCVNNGIKCVVEPCFATIIGPDYWDMVILDEAHLICNLNSQVTNNLIRMQPRYKFALTATPIPNMVWNIFSLMGWLCVPDWYQGGKANARWPYTREEIGRFRRKFVSKERDLTQELINRQNGNEPPPPRPSPLISEPAAFTQVAKTMRGIHQQGDV